MAELKHGLPSTYNNHKCRGNDCPGDPETGKTCKEAWAEYIRKGGYVKKFRAKKNADTSDS